MTSQMTEWNTYNFGPASGGKPAKIVLMLHGVGSNGQDLIGLAPYMARALPDVAFLSPDAPHPYDMAPFGRQWFSLQEYTEAAMLAGIKKTVPLLNAYIDEILAEFGLKDSDLALLGFSQGTMMSLYTAPRRAKKIAGVLGYSGALLGGEELAGANIQKLPVCLIHGEEDPVLPLERYHDAKQQLENSGFIVSGHTVPGLPHSIDDSGIQTGIAFLQEIFYGKNQG